MLPATAYAAPCWAAAQTCPLIARTFAALTGAAAPDPASKSPADAQLPPPEAASNPQAWTAATTPALVVAALHERAAPRACCNRQHPALVVAALHERAAPRA
ncbi:MAG: hypothetical protein ABSF73_06455 [Terriglobia bacterium]